MTKNSKSCNVEETKEILSITEKHLQRLIKEGSLSEIEEFGEVKILMESICEHLIDRNQRVPREYISIAQAVKNTGFKESVILSAIYRKELDATNHRLGIIITILSFAEWFSFLISKGRILPRKQKKKISGNISVKNILGLHQRPCCDLFNLSLKYQNVDTHFLLLKDDQEAHGEELLELVGLNACYKDKLKYKISGSFCEMCYLEIKALFKSFDKYRGQPIIENRYDLKALDEDIRLSLLR